MEHKTMTDECRPLTVRETFAKAAMEGMLAKGYIARPMASKADARQQLAREAWAMADAMLAAQEAAAPMVSGREDDGEPG